MVLREYLIIFHICGGQKAKKQLYVLNDDSSYLLSQLISLEMEVKSIL